MGTRRRPTKSNKDEAMPEPEYEVITPPNRLKAKVGIGGPGAVTPEVLARAEQVIADMTSTYLEWVENDLNALEEAYKDLEAASEDDKDAADRVFRLSHDIKGQGGSFGYHLMTTIGNDLCRFIEARERFGASERNIIRLHIDALRLVIVQRMQGEGDTEGETLVAGLRKVVDKIGR